MKPLLVLVTGPPGSGKTTLSRALGDAVGLPVVNRDTIKEGWWRTTGQLVTAGSPEATRAFELFFETVTFLLENDVSVIAEAAFARRFGPQELLDLGAGARTRLVRCRLDDDAWFGRFCSRAEAGDRPGHRDHDFIDRTRAHGGPDGREYLIDLPEVPTLDVDTGGGYAPDLPAIAAFVLS